MCHLIFICTALLTTATRRDFVFRSSHSREGDVSGTHWEKFYRFSTNVFNPKIGPEVQISHDNNKKCIFIIILFCKYLLLLLFNSIVSKQKRRLDCIDLPGVHVSDCGCTMWPSSVSHYIYYMNLDRRTENYNLTSAHRDTTLRLQW